MPAHYSRTRLAKVVGIYMYSARRHQLPTDAHPPLSNKDAGDQISKWIGNSAQRLCAAYDLIAGECGSNEARCFMSAMRIRRGF